MKTNENYMNEFGTEMVECENCGYEFKGLNTYHIATAHGWFCSLDCIDEYARKNKITPFQVHYG